MKSSAVSTVSKVDEDEARGGSHVCVAKALGEAGPGDNDNVSAVPISANDHFSNAFFERNSILEISYIFAIQH